jgi:hypothetical protein
MESIQIDLSKLLVFPFWHVEHKIELVVTNSYEAQNGISSTQFFSSSVITLDPQFEQV